MTRASFGGTTARDNEGGRMNGGMEVAAAAGGLFRRESSKKSGSVIVIVRLLRLDVISGRCCSCKMIVSY